MQKQKLTAALLQNYLLENKLDKSWKNDISAIFWVMST